MNYDDAILAVAARDPALASILAHHHTDIAEAKQRLDDIPAVVGRALDAHFAKQATSRTSRMDQLIRVGMLAATVLAAIAAIHK
jgi:hypothetical protein